MPVSPTAASADASPSVHHGSAASSRGRPGSAARRRRAHPGATARRPLLASARQLAWLLALMPALLPAGPTGSARAALSPQWAEPLVIEGSDAIEQVFMEHDGTGGAILAWDIISGGIHWIMFSRIAADGSTVWNRELPISNENATMAMALAVGGDYGHLVWVADFDGFLFPYVLKFKLSTGTEIWSDHDDGYRVRQSVAAEEDYLAAVGDDAGNVWIAYTTQVAEMRRVFVCPLAGTDTSPTLPWGATAGVQVVEPEVATWHQVTPRLTPDATGGAIAAWVHLWTGEGTPVIRIHAQRFAADGTRAWETEVIDPPTGSFAYEPLLTATGDGGTLLTWLRYDPGSCTRLQGCRLASQEPLLAWGPTELTDCVDVGLTPPDPVLFAEDPFTPRVTYVAPIDEDLSTIPLLVARQLDPESGASQWWNAGLVELSDDGLALASVGDGQGGAIVTHLGGLDQKIVEGVHVRADGTLDGARTTLIDRSGLQSLLVLTAAGEGSAYVVATTAAAGAGIYDLVVQRLGVPFPDCPAPEEVDLGLVCLCSARDSTILLENDSDAAIPLGIAFEADGSSAFTLLDDPLPEEIPVAGSIALAIRFAPEATGRDTATLHLGYDCRVRLTGRGIEADCEVSPTALDLGTHVRGTSSAQTSAFTLTNPSEGLLTGTVQLTAGASSGFALVGGATDYALSPGAAIGIEVSFSYDGDTLAACGTRTGLIDVGGPCGCAPVALTALLTDYGTLGALPDQLDFGEREILDDPSGDDPYSLGFTLRNDSPAGCGTWRGILTWNDPPEPPAPTDPPLFATVPAESTAIAISPEGEQAVTVLFRPGALGTYQDTLQVRDTATGAVQAIPVRGLASYGVPACAFCAQAPPETLDLGTVTLGDSAETTLCLTNTGGGQATGTALLSGAGSGAFRIENAAYAIDHGDGHTLRVVFEPAAAGTATCTLAWGDGCDHLGDRALIGRGIRPATCRISPTAIDFGEVVAGSSGARTVAVHNDGDLDLEARIRHAALDSLGLTGPAPSACVSDSAGQFWLGIAPGDSCTFALTFQPHTGGWTIEDHEQGWLPLTGGCSGLGLQVSGRSLHLGQCVTNIDYPDPSPGGELQTLDFAERLVGTADTLRFAIENEAPDPAAPVTGTITGCDGAPGAFTVLSGAGAYSVAAGEAHLVEVRFAPPDSGSYSCELATGCSADVRCQGRGRRASSACQLDPAGTLQLGPITYCAAASPPRSVTAPIRLSNLGETELAGEITLTGETGGLAIEAPAQPPAAWPVYSLAQGEELSFVLRFTPGDTLPHAALLETGATACATLAIQTHAFHPGDLDRTRRLTLLDLWGLLAHLLHSQTLSDTLLAAGLGDLNGDQHCDIADLVNLGYTLGESAGLLGAGAFRDLGVDPGTAGVARLAFTARATAAGADPGGTLRLEDLDGDALVIGFVLPAPVATVPAPAPDYTPPLGWLSWQATGPAGLAVLLCRDPADPTLRGTSGPSAPHPPSLLVGELGAGYPEAGSWGAQRAVGLVLTRTGAALGIHWDPHTGPGDSEPRILALHPNPSPGQAVSILLAAPAGRRAELVVFDLEGRRVATPWTGTFPTGPLQVAWSGRDRGGRPVPTGLYFLRWRSGSTLVQTRLLMLQ